MHSNETEVILSTTLRFWVIPAYKIHTKMSHRLANSEGRDQSRSYLFLGLGLGAGCTNRVLKWTVMRCDRKGIQWKKPGETVICGFSKPCTPPLGEMARVAFSIDLPVT